MPIPVIFWPVALSADRSILTTDAMAKGYPGSALVGTWQRVNTRPSASTIPAAIFVPPISTAPIMIHSLGELNRMKSLLPPESGSFVRAVADFPAACANGDGWGPRADSCPEHLPDWLTNR